MSVHLSWRSVVAVGATAAVQVRTNDLTYDTAAEEEFSTLINSFTRTPAPSSSTTTATEEEWTH
jgi:hypothetical protein